MVSLNRYEVCKYTLGTLYIWRPWILSNFQDPQPLVYLWPKYFYSLDLGRPIFKRTLPPPPSPTNYVTTTAPCIWTNEIKTRTKPSLITFKSFSRSIVWFSTKTVSMVSLKNDFISWLQWESTGRILVNNITDVWLSMIPVHNANFL